MYKLTHAYKDQAQNISTSNTCIMLYKKSNWKSGIDCGHGGNWQNTVALAGQDYLLSLKRNVNLKGQIHKETTTIFSYMEWA